ncbi:MAG: hypothetical protein QOF14_3200 [Hyphomicrobiales bacterium]|jgi:fructose-specific phosphotransferase system IIC component|nr:hypothetical protein [Hyphomicrobiales bacterium]
MGKAAGNEQIKLKAAFYNNLAVGSVIAGLAVPYINLMLSAPAGGVYPPRTSIQLFYIVGLVFLTLLTAWWLRAKANGALDQLQD